MSHARRSNTRILTVVGFLVFALFVGRGLESPARADNCGASVDTRSFTLGLFPCTGGPQVGGGFENATPKVVVLGEQVAGYAGCNLEDIGGPDQMVPHGTPGQWSGRTVLCFNGSWIGG